jgi:hypothetical protein
MINEFRTVDGMGIDGGNRSTRRKFIPVLFCSSKFPDL